MDKPVAGAEEPEERQVLCSGCLEVVAESRIHVIPYFNEDAEAYVTTYRCERCWLPSLNATRTRLSDTEDEAEIASAASFFDRYGVIIHEFRRGDPAGIVRDILIQALGLLERGVIRLPIDPTRAPR